MTMRSRGLVVSILAVVTAAVSACDRDGGDTRPRASGYVEATEVRVAPEVGGRVIELKVAEGDRLNAGDVIARLDTADAELTRRRLGADRDPELA